MRIAEIHSAEKQLTHLGRTSNIKWSTNIDDGIRQELNSVLNACGINNCSVSLAGLEIPPFVYLKGQNPQIFLTQNALQNSITAIPQLKALLMANMTELGLPRDGLQIPPGTKWEFIQQLHRHVPVYDGVFAPKEAIASQLFLELINDLGNSVEGKNGLELGIGSLVLTVALSRNGANMVGVDILKKAVDNSFLTRKAEALVVQNKIRIGESDLYSRLSKITGNPKFLADILIFNSPLIWGSNPYNEEDRSTYTGVDFDVPRRAVSQSPEVLAPGAVAYFLYAEVENGSGFVVCSKPKNVPIEDGHWTFRHIQEIVQQFSGSWSCEQTKYRSKTHSDPDVYFGIAKVTAP